MHQFYSVRAENSNKKVLVQHNDWSHCSRMIHTIMLTCLPNLSVTRTAQVGPTGCHGLSSLEIQGPFTSVCRMAALCSLAVRDSFSTSMCCLLSENWFVSVSSFVCRARSSVSFLDSSCFTWPI